MTMHLLLHHWIFQVPHLRVSLFFSGAPSGWHGDWHPAPRRQFSCNLAGEVEVTASDGETRLFLPGDVLLLEDTTGKGHKTKVTSEEDFIIAVVQLAE